MGGFSASVYSDESNQLVRSQVSDRMDDLYLLERGADNPSVPLSSVENVIICKNRTCKSIIQCKEHERRTPTTFPRTLKSTE